jgi:hypothetical protein
MLSERFKSAFKVALAMSIAYGIALAMNWEKPFWAGLSVAFCSLAITGDSVNRGIQRAAGTLLSGLIAFVLVGLFPQDRWLFLVVMGAVLAFITYRVTGGSRSMQIWFNAGFNLPIVVMLGGAEGLNTFNVIVLRVQETTLGVIVYSLIAVLLWPRRGGEAFEQTVSSICANQGQLFQCYFSTIFNAKDDDSVALLRSELSGQLAGLGERLEGAVYDNDQIWEARQSWRLCIRELSALNEALELIGPTVSDLKGLDMQSLAPGLRSYEAEIETRFTAFEAMLAGQPPQRKPNKVDWGLDLLALRACTHLQRAAVLLCRDQLSHIDDLTQALFARISEIRGFDVTRPSPSVKNMTQPFGLIDIDRLTATARQATAYWLTVLMILYVPAFPNPIGVLALTNAFAMILAAAPHVPSRILLRPVILGSVFAGSLYIFVLPHLSGFGSLCALIFTATFLIGYVLHQPRAALAKNMGICMLIIILGVENHQSNNFIFFAEWFLGGTLFVLILMLSWQLPISFRPEVRIVSKLARYFRSLKYLLSKNNNSSGQKVSWFSRWQQAHHLHEIKVLPGRIQSWCGMLPSAALGDTTRDHFLSIGAGLQILSAQVQALQKVSMPAQAETLTCELIVEIEGCRAVLYEACSCLVSRPESLDYATILDRLEVSLSRFRESLDSAFEANKENADLEVTYRILGTYRKISNALMDVIRRFASVDWVHLSESRF